MSKKNNSSLVLIDDNYQFRNNLRTLIQLYNQNSLSRFNLVGDADSVATGKVLLDKYEPQILLLDLELDRESGLEILKYLNDKAYRSHTLILSAHEEEKIIFQAMCLGAKGYLFKLNLVSQIVEAINTIIDEKIYLPPEAATAFFNSFNNYVNEHKNFQILDSEQKKDYHLTHREKDVLEYLVQGLSNEEIADRLYVTIATVKAHLSSIFSKFCVRNRTQAIVMTLKEKIV